MSPHVQSLDLSADLVDDGDTVFLLSVQNGASVLDDESLQSPGVESTVRSERAEKGRKGRSVIRSSWRMEYEGGQQTHLLDGLCVVSDVHQMKRDDLVASVLEGR